MPAAVVAVGAAGTVLVAATAAAGRVLGVVTLVVLTAAAAIAVRSAPRPVRGVVEFAVGLAGTAVGAGIGVRHLAKAGWSVESVAGLVSLLGGLVLLTVGAAVLTRATHGWWRMLTVPAVFATALVTVWSMSIALAATVVPPTRLDAATPADRGLSYHDAAFITADGARLSGWYLPSANGAAVVLLHGAGSTRSAVLGHAEVLTRHGYGVLLFDARGHGRSTGRGMDFGWYGDVDIAAAVTYLTTRPDVHDGRIAAVGLSMGGEQAIGAAARDGRIRAVVAEGATNRTAADKRYLVAAYGWRGALQQRIDQITYGITDLLTAAEPPISLRDAAIAAAPRPILLVTAGNVDDETLAANDIRTGSPDTVQVWQAPDTGHTGALATHPHDWEQRVTGFLADSLG
jgi:pimeloyl-ACP methyl ester carboxylesterase